MKRVTILAAVMLGLALTVLAQGCAKVSLTTQCPANSTGVGFALAGSTVGNQVLSMLGAMGGAAGMMARQGDTAPTNTATMTYEYVPIFGADSGSLNCTMPPPAPTILNPGPPASFVH